MQIDDWFDKTKSKFKMLVSYEQLKIRLYKLFNWQIHLCIYIIFRYSSPGKIYLFAKICIYELSNMFGVFVSVVDYL
jgi:hypothetical protein